MERLMIRLVRLVWMGCLMLSLVGLMLSLETRLSWGNEAPDYERFRQSMARPWYLKPALRESVGELVDLMDPRAAGFDEVRVFDTQQGIYRVYQGTVFTHAGYAQARQQVPRGSITAQLQVVIDGVTKGKSYYGRDPGWRGSYWREPGASAGLWVVQKNHAVIGHPVVVEVSVVAAHVIEAWVARGQWQLSPKQNR